MCHLTAHVSSCTAHMSLPVQCRRVCTCGVGAYPGLLRVTCVHARISPVSALVMLRQPRCTSRASPRRCKRAASWASLCMHSSLRLTHEGMLCLPPLLLWWGCCCHIPEEGSQSVPTVCNPGSPFSALAAHFLPPPSSPLTSLLSLLTNECPSRLLRQGQSPTSLCTCLSAPHGSRAGSPAGRAERITCQAPSAFPPFCLSLLPKPGQIQSEFMETISTPQRQSPVKSGLSFCLSHLCCLLGCMLKAFPRLLCDPARFRTRLLGEQVIILGNK